jgi:hypothetical protein
MWRVFPVIFKAEAVLAGNLLDGLRMLAEFDWQLLCCRAVQFDRHTVRTEWQYNLNKATPERLDAMDLVNRAAPALYLLFDCNQADPVVPACVQFIDIKGDAALRTRAPHTLRARLGPIQDHLINFIHSPDEPADVVRQLGVFFDERERRDIYAALDNPHDNWEAAAATAKQLLDRVPRVDFDVAGAATQLETSLRAMAEPSAVARRDAALSALGQVRAGQRGLWPGLRDALRSLGVPIPADVDIVLSCCTTVMHREHVPALLPTEGRTGWFDRIEAVTN